MSFFNPRKTESLFGLDIGHTSLKVMQLEVSPGKPPKAVGYGVSNFYSTDAIKNGEIIDQKTIAKALSETLNERLFGSITANKVACSLPTAHTFSRPIRLPKLTKTDLDEAIQLETEQYIPLPADKLYTDYEIISRNEQNMDLLVVAAPKTLVDSYMNFLSAVGLTPAALEPTMNATARLYNLLEPAHLQPSIMIDFGSVAIDIAVLDKTVIVNSTIQGGSDDITKMVSKKFGVSSAEATSIKNKEGIAYSDQLRDIVPVIKPMLDELIREIRRIVRYYNERVGQARKIQSVVTSGGGSKLRGLNEYISAELKLPTQTLNPWDKIDFKGLKPLSELEKSLYVTVAGEAILSSQEIHS